MPESMLIESKFSIPQLQSRLIDRPHLIDRLSAGGEKRLTLISGLPGSGKTSLMLQWMSAADLNTIWYSLDETDNDSDLFFRYFLATIGRMNEQALATVRPLLENQKKITRDKIIPVLEKCVVNLADDYYLVLDDYHNIINPSVHQVLFYFLKYIPKNFHMIIITRHTLPFSIADLKLKNQINEIAADDLKFSWEEAQTYYADTYSMHLPSTQLIELNNYLEGWIGGLQLLGIYLNHVGVWDGLKDIRTKACREAMIFMIDQVIHTQSEKVQQFIQYTAVLDRFSADLCQAVTGMEDSPKILRLVCQNNLFVSPLNDEETWFRYHRVLSEALKTRLRQDAFDVYQSIHRKASHWFAENNLIEDSFRHAFTSEDLDFLGDMLEDHLTKLYDHYEVAIFRRWLAKYPHKFFAQRPLLRLYDCRHKIESLRLLEAKSILEHFDKHQNAFARYSGTKKKLCADYLTFLKCRFNYWMDPLSVDVDLHQRLLAQIDSTNEMFQNFIRVDIAAGYFLKGEMINAKEILENIAVDILASESSRVKITWFRLMIAVERKIGHLERATALLKDANYYIAQMGLSEASIKCMLYLETAWLDYFRGDLIRGTAYATMAISYLDEATGYEHEIIEGNYLASLLHIATNETAIAEQCLQRIRQTAKLSDNAYAIAMANALCARLSVALGELEWPQTWVEQRNLRSDEPFSFRFIHECLAYAEYYIARKEYSKAIPVLTALRERCEQNRLVEVILNIDLLRCIALHGIEKRKVAVSIFDELFAYAASEGYIMPFARYAKELSPLLKTQAEKRLRNESKYRSHLRILKACGISANQTIDSERQDCTNAHDLTRREIEILQLLAEGYKYVEIADRSFISIDTVRTHIRHVYSKLGVNTKVSAIKKAEGLGIIAIA